MQAPIINSEGFEKLFAHADKMKRPAHYRLLITLMRDLGLRPIELSRLERSWFRASDLSLRIPHGQSKRKRPRTVEIQPYILELIELHMGDREGVLFLNREGWAFTAPQMTKSVMRLFKEAGVEGSAYSARRALATRLTDKNVNMVTIRDILGHQDISTTQSYCSSSPNGRRAAMYG